MIKITAAALIVAAIATAPASAQQMQVSQIGDRESLVAPDTYFTGTAIVDRLFPANANLTGGGAVVTFAPGARSAWHSHPAGQMMVVTAGRGWVQEVGQKRVLLTPGTVVWTPPGVKHWHGAAPTQSMSHLVISMVKDGKRVEWMDKVTDEEYASE